MWYSSEVIEENLVCWYALSIYHVPTFYGGVSFESI